MTSLKTDERTYIEITKEILTNPLEQLFIVSVKPDSKLNSQLPATLEADEPQTSSEKHVIKYNVRRYTEYLLLLKNGEQFPQESRGFTLFKPYENMSTIKNTIMLKALDESRKEYIAEILANPASEKIIDIDYYYNQADPNFANDFIILYKIYPTVSPYPEQTDKGELSLHQLIEQKTPSSDVGGGGRKRRKSKRKHRKSKKSRKHRKKN